MMRRQCAKCRKMKNWEPLMGGGEWYTRKNEVLASSGDGFEKREEVTLPSPYCRECTNALKKPYRQKCKAVALVEGVHSLAVGPPNNGRLNGEEFGVCEVCGENGWVDVVGHPHPGFLCRACRAVLGDGRDRQRFVTMLTVLSEHNAKERRLNDDDERRIKARFAGFSPHRRVALTRRASKRPMHRRNKFGAVENHDVCEGMENRVRVVLKWMLSPSGVVEPRNAR